MKRSLFPFLARCAACGAPAVLPQAQAAQSGLAFVLFSGHEFEVAGSTVSLMQIARKPLPGCVEYGGTFFGIPQFSPKAWHLAAALRPSAGRLDAFVVHDNFRNGFCGAPLLDQAFFLNAVESATGEVFGLRANLSAVGRPWENVNGRFRVTLTCRLQISPETSLPHAYACEDYGYPIPSAELLEVALQLE